MGPGQASLGVNEPPCPIELLDSKETGGRQPDSLVPAAVFVPGGWSFDTVKAGLFSLPLNIHFRCRMDLIWPVPMRVLAELIHHRKDPGSRPILIRGSSADHLDLTYREKRGSFGIRRKNGNARQIISIHDSTTDKIHRLSHHR
ncbi:hypothetical protein SDC9_208478 [bioreactor metagenome]|uniref:Uncharacterized protein n=1 Tax=bioreactor metagenome TaxID=1076179 RepID=A0A645JBC7_9ZZZZ